MKKIKMSDAIIGTCIGAGITLITSLFAQCVALHMKKTSSKEKFFETKRENSNKVYQTLISIINIYPKESPNDVLDIIEFPPVYHLESFDAVLKSLEYKLEDYTEILKTNNLELERKNNIQTQIYNIKYVTKKRTEIRDEYKKASDRYKQFCESDKVIFDLYAGQNVKNSLVKFDVIIHNVFISGNCAQDADDNFIEMYRRDLIQELRKDIGIIKQ